MMKVFLLFSMYSFLDTYAYCPLEKTDTVNRMRRTFIKNATIKTVSISITHEYIFIATRNS